MKSIILIHGFLSDASDFDSLIPYLEKHYDYIERVILPGHGECSENENFDCETTLRKIRDSFDKIEKGSKIDVIGYSLGGALAVYLSQVRTFDKLVLLAPACKYFNFRFPFSRYKIYAKLHQQLKEFNENGQVKKINEIEQKINDIKEDDRSSFGFVKERYFNSKFLTNFLTFRKLVKRINNEINCIKNKTLILWGEIDQLIPIKSIDYIASSCIDVRKKKYDNISHLMLLSHNNSIIISDIIEFLQDKEIK